MFLPLALLYGFRQPERNIMIYGYGRASTVGQVATEDVQRDTITKAADNIGEFGGFFYDSATTGGTELFERPQGRKLYKLLGSGDHILFHRMDRMFRNGPDGARVMEELINRKIKFSFATMPGLDTSSPFGVSFCYSQLGGAVGEKMVISERTSEALQSLRKEGKVYNNFIPTGWSRKGHDFIPDMEDRKQTELIATWKAEGMTLRKMEIKARLQKIKRPRGTHWDRNTISVALKHRAQGYPKIPQAS
jgi:DNA invertase Pin-like site-specific DNA recombinase